MADWKQWREMANESLLSAQTLEDNSCIRSAISRYYYAAYQAVSAVLLYQGLTPPLGEEAWSHSSTPEILEERFIPYILSKDRRQLLARQLHELYKLRIGADYRGTLPTKHHLSEARKYSNYLVKLVMQILPKE